MRDWIRRGITSIDEYQFRSCIDELGLQKQSVEEPYIPIYLNTIEPAQIKQDAGYELNWCKYFTGTYLKGHRSVNPTVWNSKMLRELYKLNQKIGKTSSIMLLRIRGKARLSAWLALGYVFSSVAGYKLTIQQMNHINKIDETWKNHSVAANENGVCLTKNIAEQYMKRDANHVLVTIQIARPILPQVLNYIKHAGLYFQSHIDFTPAGGPSRDSVRGSGHALAIAQRVTAAISTEVSITGNAVTHLFYSGPAALAAFLGSGLSACARIQVYEHQEPGYEPSFLLGGNF